MSKKEILIVDDDTTILRLFETAFTKAGYDIQTAESAEEALEILEETHFKVMFLDFKLPGMNGIELCKKIKKEKPPATIFAVTAYPSIFELSDCIEAGFSDYFAKPVSLETLIKSTEEAFVSMAEKATEDASSSMEKRE